MIAELKISHPKSIVKSLNQFKKLIKFSSIGQCCRNTDDIPTLNGNAKSLKEITLAPLVLPLSTVPKNQSGMGGNG